MLTIILKFCQNYFSFCHIFRRTSDKIVFISITIFCFDAPEMCFFVCLFARLFVYRTRILCGHYKTERERETETETERETERQRERDRERERDGTA